jgi:hypothetical protein
MRTVSAALLLALWAHFKLTRRRFLAAGVAHLGDAARAYLSSHRGLHTYADLHISVGAASASAAHKQWAADAQVWAHVLHELSSDERIAAVTCMRGFQQVSGLQWRAPAEYVPAAPIA